MPMTRIVFDASPLLVHKTGVAYYTERLVASLAAKYPDELELTGFYFNFLGKRPVDHLPKAPNLRYHAVRFLPSKIVYQLRRWGIEVPVEYLSGTRADFALFPNFLSYPSVNRIPNAPVVHDTAYLDLPETVSAKNRRDLQRFVPKAIDRSAFVMTVSEFTKEKLQKAYNLPADKILVTPIPPEKPRNLGREQQNRLLKNAGLDKPYILFVGTIEPRKNLTGLVKAYTMLPEKLRSKYSLVIAGRIGWNCEAEEAAFADAKARGYDVRHLGYVDEDTRAALFQNTGLFVSASNYEGFGMPVVEAMSNGAPVAASDIPVFREVAGDSALYFDQTQPEAIADAIQRILADDKLRARLAKEGRARAENITWDKLAVSVYERIRRATGKA